MRIETGAFFPDGAPSEVFLARVVVPVAGFARLGLGDHERAGAIPRCFRWCHAAFGPGGARWSVRLPQGGDAVVLFAEERDARAYFARWSDRSPAAEREPASMPAPTAVGAATVAAAVPVRAAAA
jgi:hypothetical protein